MIADRELAKELESTALIRFKDCDPFQHLNNSAYIDYFMHAREDQLNQFYDFRLFEVFQETGHAWVVTKNQIAYLAPAVMQEHVLIRTRLIEITDNVIVVEGLMLDAAARRLKSIAWIEFTFISLLNGRPAKHPDEFIRQFQPVLVDGIYEPSGFNARVDTLKNQFRARNVA
jgi:acyl-CoA thioester hydrolase